MNGIDFNSILLFTPQHSEFEAEEERRKEINTRKDEKDKERIDHLRDVIESSKTSI